MKISVIPYPNQVQLLPGSYVFQDAAEIAVRTQTVSGMEQEAYTLRIDDDGVLLCAAGEQGFFYGRETLAQMVESSVDNALPYCTITDQPAFGHRGFMIDCVRHFFPVEDLKRMIRACARLKMNVFHWHLTDDQGWRIPIDRYPQLIEKASTRPYSDFGRYVENTPHGGYYTKDEIRDVVAFCAERFIEVIPEIEMPGHASSLLAALPELSCTDAPVQVKTRGGVYEDVACLGKEATYTVYQNILDEVMELFPGERIHIGGDEAPKTHWKVCPKCQKTMEEHGLKNEGELQCYFTNKMAAYLKSKGKKVTVWNDALKSGRLHPDITMQYWTGDDDATTRHVNGGGSMIMSDYWHYYLDYSYGQTPLDKVYQYDPIPASLQAGRKKDMLGVETPIWTEYISTSEKMEYMCFPRMVAVAETAWTKAEQKDLASFHQRLKAFLPKLEQMGICAANEADWNPSGLKKVKSVANFWYHAMTWDDMKEFVVRVSGEMREARMEKKKNG